jgi:hypothetical protein
MKMSGLLSGDPAGAKTLDMAAGENRRRSTMAEALAMSNYAAFGPDEHIRFSSVAE